ncbi:hypothetical protein BDZ94DRAFT_1178128 [Collybia nuda]|uniref:Uncharacterized protein n=1 Tax=Collybia nuda TaxID=64659 RepID=A0A9P6CCN2_9AGAR|nr:hypothetical protein BDZ94DRAFT_1178128 [Collybia nuda]
MLQTRPTSIPRTTELPMELEREVIEWAARAHRTCAVKLALVGKRFQAWSEPIIYETVVLDEGYPATSTTMFLRTLRSRPAEFFAQNVKNIYLTSAIQFHQAQKILSICTGATNIACWADPGPNADCSVLLNRREPLRRLSSKLEVLCQIETTNTAPPMRLNVPPDAFINLSHLDIVNPPFIAFDGTWLHSLPALTHLAFGDLLTPYHLHMFDVFSGLLSECKLLKTLVIMSSDRLFSVELEKSGLCDQRVVFLPCYHYPRSAKEYWQDIRRGGSDFWEFADQMVGSLTS